MTKHNLLVFDIWVDLSGFKNITKYFEKVFKAKKKKKKIGKSLK